MNRFLLQHCWCILLTLAIFALPLASAQDASVTVGFRGVYKNGAWTQVVVNNAESEKFTLVASDPDGIDVIFSPDSINTAYVKLGRATGSLAIHQQSTASQVLAPPRDFPPPIPNERPIYLVIGSDPAWLADAVALLRLPEHRRPVIVAIESFAELPDHWRGYEAVALVAVASSPEAFGGMTASSPQIVALNRWVSLGGKLFLAAGRNAASLLVDATSPLTPFLPGRFTQPATLYHSEPITLLAASHRPLIMTGSAETPFVQMPHFAESRGLVLARDGDLIVASRSAFGMGTITYFGGDLDAAPLRGWRDRPTLVLKLLGESDSRQTTATPQQTLIQLGYNDLSGQIRSALDAACGVVTTPFSRILVVMVVYLVAVGLGDWFLVHRVLRRPGATWITFPLLVVLFGAVALWLGAGGRPETLTLNRVTLHDIDTVSQTNRTTCWTSAYSPCDTLTTLNFADSNSSQSNQETYACWLGLPGRGLGGMNPKTYAPRIWDESYRCNGDTLTDVPIAVRSTKSFLATAVSWQDAAHATPLLTEEQGIPVGTWVNPLDEPLSEAVLLYGRWVIILGEVAPGECVAVTSQRPRCEPRELLYRHDTTTSATSRVARYNTQSRDPMAMLRAMGFYRWLGGYDAIGLYDEHQRLLDMSELLTTDRAVVFARSSQERFVRVVVPVSVPERVAVAEVTRPDDPLRERDTTHGTPELDK